MTLLLDASFRLQSERFQKFHAEVAGPHLLRQRGWLTTQDPQNLNHVCQGLKQIPEISGGFSEVPLRMFKLRMEGAFGCGLYAAAVAARKLARGGK